MADQRLYHAPGLDVQKLAKELESWFRQRDLEAQTLPGVGGGAVVQARMTKQLLLRGSLALTVTLTPQGENLLVQTGAAKWGVHAATGVAAALIFWPLLALPAYGAYKQKELIDETWAFLDRYVGTAGGSALTAAPAVQGGAGTCPECGAALVEGAKFCPSCGAKLAQECGKCGAILLPGAKFCANCGAPVGQDSAGGSSNEGET